MNPTIADHLLGLLLAVPLPLVGVWQFRRLKARLAAGERGVRLSHYRAVLAEEVLLTGTVLALWLLLGRPWDRLAPTTPISGAWLVWVGWAVTAVACVLLVVQTVALARSEEGLADARRQLEPMAEFLPHTRRELKSFRLLSVAAGVGEEVVFRGFALAWLASLASSGFGLDPAAALTAGVAGSSALFGLAHAYQGPSGIVKTALLGLFFAGVAVATGGLAAPMLLHAVVDLTSGQAAFLALGRTGVSDPEPATP